MTDVTFKNVDATILREFKAEAVREDKTFGEALAEAILAWLEHKHSCMTKKKAKLSDLTPVSFGKGSERGSVEVDRIVYGV